MWASAGGRGGKEDLITMVLAMGFASVLIDLDDDSLQVIFSREVVNLHLALLLELTFGVMSPRKESALTVMSAAKRRRMLSFMIYSSLVMLKVSSLSPPTIGG